MDTQANDYSCYIRVNNKTDVDFGLTDTTVKDGEWPQGQPPNTIEANSGVDLHLKDKSGPSGSEGSATYSLELKKHPDTKITFKLNFSDPYSGWNDNFLGGSTNHPELISINVHPYSKSGHPFYGEVDIYAAGSKSFTSGQGERNIAEMHKAAKAQLEATKDHMDIFLRIAQVVQTPATDRLLSEFLHIADSELIVLDISLEGYTGMEKGPFQADFSIGFKPEGHIPINKDPVHENIAIAAFIKAKQLPEGTTYNNLNPKQWEYFRGLLWNDDPSCLLFDDKTDNNRDFGAGLDWYNEFKNGPVKCMTKRSHFGDLQCLHGMASRSGEAPEATKRNMLTWMEIMYKLACGNQGVEVQDKLKAVLPAHFNGSTEPTSDATLKQLLMATTPKYRFPDIRRRALGVCLHIIQDSYAVGHTQRCLLNPEDLAGRDENGFIRFKSGTYGRWGPIVSFHCYSGQDSDRHSHYDSLEGEAPVPKRLDTFNKIVGARDAIEKSIVLIKFSTGGAKWEDGVKDFLEQEVFALARNPKPANSEVDGSMGSCMTGTRAMTDARRDFEYMAGLQQKLTSLESAASHDVEAISSNPLWARRKGKRSLLRLVLFVLLGVLALVVAIISSAVISRVVSKILF